MYERRVNIPVRVDEKTWKLLKYICEARGETISTFIRRTIKQKLAELRMLDDETARLLQS